jgi:hypothetical protein
VAIGSALGQDVPDGDEQLAGDGDDGDALRLVAAETGVGVDGAPGGFDEHAAQVAAALFADVSVPLRLAAVVDADSQSTIANRELSPFGHVFKHQVVSARYEGHGIEYHPKVKENGCTEHGNPSGALSEIALIVCR